MENWSISDSLSMCFTDLRDDSQTADGEQGVATSHPGHTLHVQPHAAIFTNHAGNEDSLDSLHSKYTTEHNSASQYFGEEQGYTFPSSSIKFPEKAHTINQNTINQHNDHQNYKGSSGHISVSNVPNNCENIAGEGVTTEDMRNVSRRCNIISNESVLICNSITKNSVADSLFDFAGDGNMDVTRDMKHVEIIRNNKADGKELINLDLDKLEKSICQETMDSHNQQTLSKYVVQEPINQICDPQDDKATATSSFSKIDRDNKEKNQRGDCVSNRDECRKIFDPG